MALSPRLRAIVELIPPGPRLVDVGTDHAWVPMAAVGSGRVARAVGVDLRPGPLAIAARLVAELGLGERIELRQGDGLTGLEPAHLDQATVVIAGLTGPTVVAILTAGERALAGAAGLITQPVQDAYRVRAWARAHGWHVADEQLTEERGRTYATTRFVPGAGPDPAYPLDEDAAWAAVQLGPRLLARPTAGLVAWCRSRATHAARWGHADAARWAEALRQLEGAP